MFTLKELKEIARDAGRQILSHYHDDIRVDLKADDSPLTAADRASHETIVSHLRAAFPGVPVISEEGYLPSAEERAELERFWLVDPLDGTKEFIKRNGEFTVNIALIENGKPVQGVVYIPVQDRMYSAAVGCGAWVEQGDGEPRQINAKADFDDKERLAVSVSRSHPSGALAEFLKGFTNIDQRPLGSSLKFCLIAEGEVDFYPRFGPLMEWDTAAAHIVAAEAGAIITDLEGNPLRYNKPIMKHGNLLVAASRPLFEYLLNRIRNTG
jgi:3'(2'), 5'-bisphosphate nucleotidase